MGFLEGKKVLILGLLSDRSIAYGIASAMKKQGAELAFTYQMEKHQGRVEKLAANFDSNLVLPCDVSNDDHITELFPKLSAFWNKFDILIHLACISNDPSFELNPKLGKSINFKSKIRIYKFNK
jgi:enoyl-[acyl-carrier protein] reductase I